MKIASDDAAIHIATACSVLAIICGLVELLGWQLQEPLLTSFGIAEVPAWPLAGVSALTLGAALFCAARGASAATVRLLVVVPAFISAACLVEYATGRDLGIDWLMFPNQLRLHTAAHPGRLGSTTCVVLLLLSLGVDQAIRDRPAARRIATICASLALGLSLAAITVAPQLDTFVGRPQQHFVTSLPAALTNVMVALGVLAFRVDRDDTPFSSRTPELRIGRLLLPLVLVAPFAASMIEAALMRSGTATALEAEVVAIGLNIVIVAALLIWGGARLMRKRAALEELTHAVDSAPIALTDETGCITHWSRGCEDLYGWNAAEAIGRVKRELLRTTLLPSGPADEPHRHGAGEQVLQEIRRDGGTVRVLEQARWVQRPNKPPLQVLSMTDIGPRLDAEEAMRASEERLSLATSAHEVGVFEWDAQSNHITWSAGSEQRLGLKPGSLSTYERWSESLLPDDLEAVAGSIRAAVAAKADRFGFRYRFRELNGAVRAIEGSARCFYDADGELVRTLGVNIDVTEREEHVAALHAREAQLRSILDTVPDAMIVFDERGVMTRFSRAAEELFGYPEEQAAGRNISMLLNDAHSADHDDILKRFCEAGERGASGRTLTAVRADGREVPIELRIGEAQIGAGRMFTGFVRDISERLLAEERLSQLRTELTHVARLNAMGEMAASLAHELNQPLAAIVNFLATADMMMKAGAPPERAGEMLSMASGQAVRAGEIIRRLREFIARRDTEMTVEPVDSIIHDAVALALVGVQRVDVGVVYDLDPAANRMLADRVQIQQVLVNLLRNSVEALAPLPKDQQEVRITSRAVSDELLEISVRDSGPGIPQGVLSRMYTPFTSTKGEGGMGIGLSICRRIVEAHGGQIVAENMPDGGACFRFTLPRVDQKELGA